MKSAFRPPDTALAPVGMRERPCPATFNHYKSVTTGYTQSVHGASAVDIWKERPMLVRIVIEIRIWGWRLRIRLSRR